MEEDQDLSPLEARLPEAFGAAEPEHFAWQTRHPVVSRSEAELIAAAFLPLGRRVLDLGCAEGATLYHLGDPEGAVGVDLFEPKLAFARTQLSRARFVRASAYELPFEDGSFDHVLVRDVLHHMDHPARAVSEIARVLGAGGRLDLLEPCRNNPLIFAHGLLLRAERGELRSTPRFLEQLVARELCVVGLGQHQALPLSRVVFHPRLDRVLGAAPRGLLERVTRSAERLSERLLPRSAWAYLHLRALKR